MRAATARGARVGRKALRRPSGRRSAFFYVRHLLPVVFDLMLGLFLSVLSLFIAQT
jgi:hypothetical protein